MRDRASAGAPQNAGEILTEAILVINAGSSSIKFSLFPGEQRPTRENLFCDGQCAGIGHRVRFTAKSGAGASLLDQHLGGGATHEDVLAALLRWLGQRFPKLRLIAAGHRVVHGGREFAKPVIVSPEVMKKLEALNPLAPLHQPHNLAAINALSKLHPKLAQVACFDTSFHATQPAVAAAFALPRALSDQGVKRYGFHGLSYEYIASVLPDHLRAKGRWKSCGRSSRPWRQHVRHVPTTKRRDDDGLFCAGWTGDGPTLWSA
jgi:acetate kinase